MAPISVPLSTISTGVALKLLQTFRSSDGTNNYVYDWANRLTEVWSGGQKIAEYTYDATNRRVSKFLPTSSETFSFIYNDGQVIEEYLNGSLARTYTYGAYIDDPLMVEYGGQRYFCLKDRRYSVTALTDAAGSIVETYEYSAFGRMNIFDATGQDITATGSTIGNPYGFTGRRFDAETGLWYYRNRMYSPVLGRFLQRDPAGYVDGLNLYAYTMNNPLSYLDPDGLIARDAWNSWSDSVVQTTENTIKGGESYLFPVFDWVKEAARYYSSDDFTDDINAVFETIHSLNHGNPDDIYAVERIQEGPQNNYERMNWDRFSETYQDSYQNFSYHFEETKFTTTTEEVQFSIDKTLGVVSLAATGISLFNPPVKVARTAVALSLSADLASFSRTRDPFQMLPDALPVLIPGTTGKVAAFAGSSINLLRP